MIVKSPAKPAFRCSNEGEPKGAIGANPGDVPRDVPNKSGNRPGKAWEFQWEKWGIYGGLKLSI